MNPTRGATLPPLLILGVGILSVSSGATLVRLAQGSLPSLVVAAGRLSLAAVLLIPWVLVAHRQTLRALEPGDWRATLLAGLALALHFASWISSLEHTSVVSSVVFVSTTPLWVALLSPWMAGESMGSGAWVGLGLASAGGLLLGLSDLGPGAGAAPLKGNLLALGGALSAALYLVLGRRVRVRLALAPYLLLVNGVAALVLLLAVLVLRVPLAGHAPADYGWLILLALVPQLLGHGSLNAALRWLPASFIAVALLGEPVGATLLALVLLGEVPGRLQLLGGLVILAGIAWTARAQTRGRTELGRSG